MWWRAKLFVEVFLIRRASQASCAQTARYVFTASQVLKPLTGDETGRYGPCGTNTARRSTCGAEVAAGRRAGKPGHSLTWFISDSVLFLLAIRRRAACGVIEHKCASGRAECWLAARAAASPRSAGPAACRRTPPRRACTDSAAGPTTSLIPAHEHFRRELVFAFTRLESLRNSRWSLSCRFRSPGSVLAAGYFYCHRWVQTYERLGRAAS